MTYLDPINKDDYAPTQADMVAAQHTATSIGSTANEFPNTENSGAIAAEPSATPMRNMSKGKKIAFGIIGGVLVAACIFGGAYIINANHYEDHFLPHTIVQSVDVSGMTVTEAQSSIAEGFKESETILSESGQEDIVIAGDEISLRPAGDELSEIMRRQDKWSWPAKALGAPQEYAIGIMYDNEKLTGIVSKLDCIDTETRQAPENATIKYDEASQGFVTVPAKRGNLVDTEKLYPAISQSISNGGGTIQLEEFYTDPQYDENSDEIVEAASRANAVIGKTIKYNIDGIDDAETLSKEQIVSFVTLGEDMALAANEENIKAWLRDMGEKYDTVGKEKTYTTAYGKEVTLSGGTYGWITDEAAMLPIVCENVLSDEDEIDQDFVYQQEAAGPAGSGEWGDTYIDIDITDQKVRVVQNGEITHDFVCITGKPDGKHDSTEGEHQVVRIEKDFIMTGELNANGVPEYRTPCDYFIAWASDGCAMHDANWQAWGAWNSNRYKTGYGSHGCANMRPTDAAVIYDIAYMGMPVLVHK